MMFTGLISFYCCILLTKSLHPSLISLNTVDYLEVLINEHHTAFTKLLLGITCSLIIIYVILLRMRTHSCIVVGIVKEKRNTVLRRKRLGKDSLAKRTAKTHTSARQKERL